jgi:hypothetical protein
MKKVKFDGQRWILMIDEQGLLNPHTEVFFANEHQDEIAKLIKRNIIGDAQPNVIYQIPNSGIYTAAHGPKCGPLWPDSNCYECGGKGVLAVFDDTGLQMGGIDLFYKEIQKIKDGTSTIGPAS